MCSGDAGDGTGLTTDRESLAAQSYLIMGYRDRKWTKLQTLETQSQMAYFLHQGSDSQRCAQIHESTFLIQTITGEQACARNVTVPDREVEIVRDEFWTLLFI